MFTMPSLVCKTDRTRGLVSQTIPLHWLIPFYIIIESVDSISRDGPDCSIYDSDVKHFKTENISVCVQTDSSLLTVTIVNYV